MYAYIKGKAVGLSPTELILELTNGLAYQLSISLFTYNEIKNQENLKILTHLIVKEDSHTLFGFSTDAERDLFKLLISVSGVGPNTARLLLSTLSPQELRMAIVSENIALLKKAKGIGPKAAKRIILELKDKVIKEGGAESTVLEKTLTFDNKVREEALSALIALGFNRVQVNKTLSKLLNEDPGISDAGVLIKKALAFLTS